MAKRRPPRRPPRDPQPPDDDSRVRFPFGETADDDAWDADEPEPSSAQRLPSLPPGSRLEDDASLDGLDVSGDAEVVDLDDSDALAALVAGDDDPDLGPIDGSGPLVIVPDEGEDASARYQASIVDDSARIAGATSAREPRPRERRGASARRSWREEALDPDAEVPTLSGRRSPPAPAADARRVGRGALALALLAGLAVGGGVAGWIEHRRREDLTALARVHQDALSALAVERDEARADAQRREGEARRAGEAALEAERRARADAAAQARSDALLEARREAQAAAARAGEEARAAARAAEEAFEVELARARSEERAQADARAAAAAEAARREAKAAEGAALEEARGQLAELEQAKRELEARLAAATTRAEEEAIARRLAEERSRALDAVEPEGGGSASAGVDDWDALFEEAFAEAGDGEATGTTAAGAAVAGEDAGEVLHPVDRAWAWLRANVHGNVAYKNLTHFSSGFDRDQRQTRHELRVNLEYRDWLVRDEAGTKGLRAVVAADVRVDDADYAAGALENVDDEARRRPIVVPSEAYLALTLDWFELRGGYQVFAWGTGDLFNPTDNLNPIDFSDLFDSRRIPVLAAAVTLDVGSWALELVSIPTFTRSRLPLRGERFDLLRAAPVPVLRPDDPDFVAENAQWGARGTMRLGGWDVSLSGFTGWSDIPSPRLGVQAGTGLPLIEPVFDRIHVLGADFATTLGFLGVEGRLGEVLSGVQLHGEAAHTWTTAREAADFLQYVLGFNYTFVDVLGEHDLSIGLEYAGDVETRAPEGDLANVARVDRVFKGAWLTRLEYKIERQYLDLSLELIAAVITYGRENALLHPSATWRVTDHLHLMLGGDVFVGPDETFFGQFRRDGRLLFEARVEF